jgi:uncharacterized tellurite resistance protein B-like protein
MPTLEQKNGLLSDLISFSIIDGKLHKKEYDFILLIATELGIRKVDLDVLFHEEIVPITIKNELDRVIHFYRLALLMHIDGVIHVKENIKLHEIGIQMGLDPNAIKTIINLMENNENCIVNEQVILEAFEIQKN